MYTIKTIKKTKVYLANVKKVRKIWPDHVEDFAEELMVAANWLEDSVFKFNRDTPSILGAFVWKETPQGREPWFNIYQALLEA